MEDNCESEKGRITLESVFYMAHRLKLITVVEGVETKEQLDFINTCDCDYIQGFLFSKPVPRDEFFNMCTNEAPVAVDFFDPFSSQTAFGQVRALIDAVYSKFHMVIIVNLTRDSYHVMKRETLMNTLLPETGSYTEGYKYARSMCKEEDKETLDKAFTRENLLEAYKRGKKSVVRIVAQCTEEGTYHKVAFEDYFMHHPDSNDIFMVSFIHYVDYSDDTYIGDVRFGYSQNQNPKSNQ